MKTFALFSQGRCGSVTMVNRLKEIGLKRQHPEGFYQVHNRYRPIDRKVLFMYGDPRNILLSSLKSGEEFIRMHCMALQGHEDFFKIGTTTLLSIIKFDPLDLAEHFMSWFNAKTEHPIMFLRYESLEDPSTFSKVLDFFEVESDLEYDWKPRATSYLDLPIQQQEQFTKLFEPLLQIQQCLGPCHRQVDGRVVL